MSLFDKNMGAAVRETDAFVDRLNSIAARGRVQGDDHERDKEPVEASRVVQRRFWTPSDLADDAAAAK
jgi:hypothetical protein